MDQPNNLTIAARMKRSARAHGLCCPKQAPDTAGSSATISGVRGLPLHLLTQAASRLRLVSLLMAAIALLGLFLDLVLPRLDSAFAGVETCPFTNSSVLFASLLVFGLSTRIAPTRALTIGLVYQVAVAYGISIAELFTPLSADATVFGVSWVCVWIAIYPLIVPTPPRRAMVTAFLAASMGPLALWVTTLGGNPLPATETIFRLFWPNYAAAAIAVIPSLVVYRLGRELNRAEEMGSYRMIEKLGQGGMGEVWLAKHRRLARPAAIKIIRPDFVTHKSEDEALRTIARFEREAQATALLNSPHTVRVYDFGTTEEGAFFYVMELLDGLDLETLVERFGPLSPARTVNFLRQASESLAEAHRRGMVHRDIKPANMYVCRSGINYDFIKVLDFGLVKTDTSGADAQLTQEGITTGTPAYMAPEMATGSGEIDGRADIYSLGAVAYFLLTGKMVFEGASGLQVALQHINVVPVPPSERTELDVPAKLEQLILSMLEKDPQNRPANAEELIALLDDAQMDTVWSNARAEHWWSTHMPQQTAELGPVTS